MKYKVIILFFAITIIGLIVLVCKKHLTPKMTKDIVMPKLLEIEPPLANIVVTHEVTVRDFFKFIDETVQQNDTLPYQLTENLLLRANPWLLDSLVGTDYYYQISRGNFIYDQRNLLIIRPGDTLQIPGPKTAAILIEKMAVTRLELNIPAFEMRIWEGDSILFKIPVRVGKVQKKYLEMAGGTVDLRTRTGLGEIVRVNRTPTFYDPVTGKQFEFTKRDDKKTTVMPQIPWLEPSINGQRYGQMIHPTTNPRTLGKAASNGCIGTGEADAWRVYFYAPIGTKVLVRYDLEEVNAQCDTIRYEDVYRLRRARKSGEAMVVAGFFESKTADICVCDSLF
jgi:L,D-transpeptidase catalytic domain